MPKSRIDLKIYHAEKFGYYSRKNGVEPDDDIGSILNDLKNWIAKSNLVTNCTYETSEAGSDKTLCLSVIKSSANSDYLLTLWAGVDTGDKNQVGAILPNASSDNIDVEEKAFTAGSIPGYPIYFYLIPSKKLISPVKIDGSKNGIQSFRRYMRGFLDRFSNRCHYNQNENGDHEISYYGDDPEEGYYPSLAYSNWQKKDIRDTILDRRGEITRITKKDVVFRAAETSYLRRVLGGINGNEQSYRGRKFKYELDYTPTEDELVNMFNDYDSLHKDGAEAELDYGFKVKGEILWLSHAIQKHSFNADIRRRNGIIYSSQSLLSAISAHRSLIIAQLDD